jgi:hypothetical protein
MYAKQIGIADNEIPVLVFNLRDFNKRLIEHGQKPYRKSKKTLGTVSDESRTIMINEMLRGRNGYVTDYRRNSKGKKMMLKRDGQRYWKLKNTKIGLVEFNNTLVHELVHYRFKDWSHSNRF